MSFININRALLDQGKIHLKTVSLIPHIQEHVYQTDIVVPYNPADPASDTTGIEAPELGELTRSRLDILRENVTNAYMFKTFHFHKYIEHENECRPVLFTRQNGRLVDHEPELINTDAWYDRRLRYVALQEATDSQPKGTTSWEDHARLEITLMLRQMVLMDIQERDIKIAKIAAARKAEYEQHLEEAPQERRLSFDYDARKYSIAAAEVERVHRIYHGLN